MADCALVTGASGGIGEEIAKVLAAKKHDLVLVARNRAKLEALAASLAAQHGVKAEAVALDLTDPAAPERLAGRSVDVLVNNAGIGTFGPFAESELKAELAQIQLNVTALTHLTKLLLPGMLARKRGRILNVASLAAFQPGPLMAVYYATKAYVLSFSEALSNELKGTGVTSTCLCPGGTRTDFMERARMGDPEAVKKFAGMMDASVVAKKGVAGMMKGKRLVIPGFTNKVLALSTRLGSRGMSASVVRGINENIRATGKKA